MTFGQQSGPPASARKVQELLALLQDAGHADFREARGPMGLTQRQAGGRFTREEAEVLIERLRDSEEAGAPTTGRSVPEPTPSGAEQALHRHTTEQLAAELQRRGWIVIEP